MRFAEGPARDVYRLLAWGPGRMALAWAPAGSEIAVCRAVGRLAARGPWRRRVRANLEAVFGPDPRLDRWTDEAFATHFAHQYVGAAFDKVRPDRPMVAFSGLEHLDAALAAGRGAVVAHPHMGLAPLALQALAVRGYVVHQVAGGPVGELSRVGRWAADARTRLDGRLRARMHDARRYVRPLLRALARNEVVLTALDGTGGGVELGRRRRVPILGHPMDLAVFPAWLADNTGAAVLPMACFHDGGERAVLEPPVRDLDALAARFEAMLRDHPGDWHFWDQWPGQWDPDVRQKRRG